MAAVHCLVVDDEREMCWVLDWILRRGGIACLTALDATTAMALAGQHDFSLAFLDAKLPDVDGLDLARWLRERRPGIRIILVSGGFYQDDATIGKAMESGLIQAFIAKPFSHAEILRHACPPGAAPPDGPA